jgi:hypothetical protein
MAASLLEKNPQIVGNDYLVMGTLERQDWKQGNQGLLSSKEIIERMYVFEDQWNFKVIPAGWYPNQST